MKIDLFAKKRTHATLQRSMNNLTSLARLVRYYILKSTTEAGSGHPSSSLSAVELMVGLMFGGFFHYDAKTPEALNNDRIIFSKGHASPLFYALWTAAGLVDEQELMTLRKLGSRLEGHPTMDFPYTEVPTGSLGQGLSVGVGMALNAKLDGLPYRTFVLLGDSEMAEGSQWEAMQLASYYKLNNLVGIIDVNRLGQRGETMLGHDLDVYQRRAEAFGWEVILLDGHNIDEVTVAYTKAQASTDKPVMLIAKTLKGKGVAVLENKDNWHGKPLKVEECTQALQELGEVDTALRGTFTQPQAVSQPVAATQQLELPPMHTYDPSKPVATRKAYGQALARLGATIPELVVLDAETSNSTYSEMFKEKFANRFFEMFIAEQNMVSAAMGFARRGKIPFASTFAAFFSRAFDQIRMSQYAGSNIKLCGSHAGVSIGEDGASQMGLEDMAMFRTVLGSVVLYPCDAVSAERMVELAAQHTGLVYIRTTRKETPIMYSPEHTFQIGGSQVVKHSEQDVVTVVGAGITLVEALKAYESLKAQGVMVRVIDAYSVKPIDQVALLAAAAATKGVVTVEDHFAEGGLGEAVRTALADSAAPVVSLAVRKMPHSGKPDELLKYEEIDSEAIQAAVKKFV